MKITANFRAFEAGKMKGYVDLTVNDSVSIKDAKLFEGPNGLFLSMPQRKVGDEYRDVVVAVSQEFAAQALEVALAARENENGFAYGGKFSRNSYNVHVTPLKESTGHCKALGSLTVYESKDAEKSSFTVNDLRVLKGEKTFFIGMPSVPTGNEDYPYNELVSFEEGSKNFIDGLIIGKAMDELGIEKKSKAGLDARVNGAADKVKEASTVQANEKGKDSERGE